MIDLSALGMPYESVASIDTIVVRVRYKPDDGFIKRLQGECLRKVRAEPSKFRFWRVTCHRPTRAALNTLDSLVEEYDGQVQSAHVALDLMCETREEAVDLLDWFARHLDKPYERKAGQIYEGVVLDDDPDDEWRGPYTIYCQLRTWGRVGIAVYARESKVTGQPCVHVEIRFNGATAIKRLKGVTKPSDVAGIDPVELFPRFIGLREVDVRSIGRQLLGRSRSKKPKIDMVGGIPYDRELRAGGHIARLSAYSYNPDKHEEGAVLSPQAVRQYCRGFSWFRMETACRKIDWNQVTGLPSGLVF